MDSAIRHHSFYANLSLLKGKDREFVRKLCRYSAGKRRIRKCLLLLLLLVITMYLVNSTYNPFIYFRF